MSHCIFICRSLCSLYRSYLWHSTQVRCVTRKQTWRSLSLLYLLLVWHRLLENMIYEVKRLKFWKVGVIPRAPILLLVWQRQRPWGLFSVDTPQVLSISRISCQHSFHNPIFDKHKVSSSHYITCYREHSLFILAHCQYGLKPDSNLIQWHKGNILFYLADIVFYALTYRKHQRKGERTVVYSKKWYYLDASCSGEQKGR